MPSKIWAILAILIVGGGLTKWAHYTVDIGGYNRHKAESLNAVNEAVAADRLAEKNKQDKIDEAAKKQLTKLNGINDQLNADLDRLRERTSRKQQAKGAKPKCKGATGASVSFEDAGFLTREAARADKIRTGLGACYDYADTVVK